LLAPRPGQPVVEKVLIDWHHRQVFKGGGSLTGGSASVDVQDLPGDVRR
jgi:hypothetical protein